MIRGDVVFRWPFRNVTSGTSCSTTNRSIAPTNARLIGSISADDANGWPRWPRKKCATPAGLCSRGT
jgi:hypothetical protein